MSKGVYLAFDVGGTYIKAGAVDAAGCILEQALNQYESKANASAEEILEHFAEIAVDVIDRISLQEGEQILGIGYAFPGPFDYEQGISYIRGLDKFESLYGVRVGERLLDQLWKNSRVAEKLVPDVRLRFENDASLFALGEAHFGQAVDSQSAVCLTIGTGLGSGFIKQSALVTHGDGVPDHGWLYHLPYGSSIVDDYISRRGFLSLASSMGIDNRGRDVKEYAESATNGDEEALRLFEAFGKRMAEALADSLRAFQPEIIVLGGQISKSGALFIPSFSRELESRGLNTSIKISHDTLQSTMLGIFYILGNKI